MTTSARSDTESHDRREQHLTRAIQEIRARSDAESHDRREPCLTRAILKSPRSDTESRGRR